jgi:hypothetical protein
VLEEKKCMMCKQENPHVFFTRYMGDFTVRLGAPQFEALKVQASVAVGSWNAWQPLCLQCPAAAAIPILIVDSR